jgi:putative FmdB family regulatory protein
MPTYDYQCDACGHRFEEFQSITAEALKKCPECSRKKLRRLIGAGVGLIFKGSGFYCTDYRSSSYSKAAAAENGSSKSSSEGSSNGSAKSGSENGTAAKSSGSSSEGKSKSKSSAKNK